MSNYPIGNLFLLGLIEHECFWNFMDLYFTAISGFLALVQNGGYTDLLVATWVHIVWTEWAMKRHFYFWSLFMDVAITELRYVVVLIASITLENLQVWPHLPIDLSPGNSIRFSDECYKFFEVPGSVNNVLSSDLAVIIYVGFSLWAIQNFSLAHGE